MESSGIVIPLHSGDRTNRRERKQFRCNKDCQYGFDTDVEGRQLCKCKDPCKVSEGVEKRGFSFSFVSSIHLWYCKLEWEACWRYEPAETPPGLGSHLTILWLWSIIVKIIPRLSRIHLFLLFKSSRISAGDMWTNDLGWSTPNLPGPSTGLVAGASHWISCCSGRVELASGVVSFEYANPA